VRSHGREPHKPNYIFFSAFFFFFFFFAMVIVLSVSVDQRQGKFRELCGLKFLGLFRPLAGISMAQGVSARNIKVEKTLIFP
jgi:hypothetical protein